MTVAKSRTFESHQLPPRQIVSLLLLPSEDRPLAGGKNQYFHLFPPYITTNNILLHGSTSTQCEQINIYHKELHGGHFLAFTIKNNDNRYSYTCTHSCTAGISGSNPAFSNPLLQTASHFITPFFSIKTHQTENKVHNI